MSKNKITVTIKSQSGGTWPEAEFNIHQKVRHLLEKAIDELPPDYRTALVMHDVQGMPNPDIAETLGISLPAVKSRVHRSRLFVRKKLASYLGRA